MKLKCMAMPGSGELEKWGNSEVLCLFGNEVEVPDADGELMQGCKYWEVLSEAEVASESDASPEPAKSPPSEKKPRGRRKSSRAVDSDDHVGDNSSSGDAD